MPKIESKKAFYRLWSAGLLGNKPRTWDSLAEAVASNFPGVVAIRYRGHGPRGPFVTNLTIHQLVDAVRALTAEGWKEDDFNFTEQLSPDRVTYLINGEVMRGFRGLELFYATENKLMRDALISSGRHVYGMEALAILQTFLWAHDFEELMDLLDAFPDHVVEFSGFDRKVGMVPGKRMVVWEVRLY